jgi:hypothetical protein
MVPISASLFGRNILRYQKMGNSAGESCGVEVLRVAKAKSLSNECAGCTYHTQNLSFLNSFCDHGLMDISQKNRS